MMSHLDLNEYRKREKKKPQVVIGELKKMIDQLQAENERLKKVVEKALEWMTWIKLRNKCTCESNSRCVKCVVTDEIVQAEKTLQKNWGI